MKPGRNDPCICGSGKKYKKCCQDKHERGMTQTDSQQSNVSGAAASSASRVTHEINQLIALLNAGRFGEVEVNAHRMVKRHPDLGLVWKILALCLLMQGKDALSALQKATGLLPADAELHNHLGIVLTAKERFSEAEACLQRACRINPGYAEAYYNLNVACMAQGRFSEAEAALQRALEIRPDYAMAYYGLGLVLKAQGRLPEAEANLQRALELKPDFAGGHYCLGYLFMEQGRSPEAESCFMRALKLEPNYDEARNKLGICYAEQGRFTDAEACYRRGLEINPNDIEARFNLAVIKKVDGADENLAALIAIEEAARNNGKKLSGKEAVMLNFALGKAFEDSGNYEKAFPYFLEGARQKRATFDYDPKRTTERFGDIARIFDVAAMERLNGSGDSSRLPIFILGMPRSGTTLVEQIISSHPDVHGAGELPDLLEIATGAVAGAESFPDGLPELNRERLAAMGSEYIARLQRRTPEARRITDKMLANFTAVGLIHLMLPNAKIIHVRRNPIDTCLSCFVQLFQGQMEFSYDLSELGRYYVDYERLMEHWREVLPSDAIFEVSYEDIVADQEAQARRLIEHCGLDWNDACLEFYKNKRTVRTASVAQVRQPTYKSSVERWRRYEGFLRPLLDTLGASPPLLLQKNNTAFINF